MNTKEKSIKKFLPSKLFIRKAIILLVLVLTVLLITKIIPSVRKNMAQKQLGETLLVKDLVIQDQNSNGIQDWEEALWGLDPSADGASNKEYILAKKKLLNKDNIPEGELTEDDKMAREFFALVVSLQQSGNLNETSMKALADSIGQKVVAADIDNMYTESMLDIENTTQASLKKYYSALQKLNIKYKDRDIGGELAFIGQAIANNDTQALRIGIVTANDYRSFGKDLLTITVPTSLVDMHLELANNYEKSALTLEAMGNILENPTSGMASLVKYKRYNNMLIETLEKMRTFFVRNGIIK